MIYSSNRNFQLIQFIVSISSHFCPLRLTALDPEFTLILKIQFTKRNRTEHIRGIFETMRDINWHLHLHLLYRMTEIDTCSEHQCFKKVLLELLRHSPLLAKLLIQVHEADWRYRRGLRVKTIRMLVAFRQNVTEKERGYVAHAVICYRYSPRQQRINYHVDHLLVDELQFKVGSAS